MESFAEFIAESFHSEAQVTWKLKSTTHAVAAFSVRTVSVEVDFEQRELNRPWHVAFKTVGGEMADRTNLWLAFPIFDGVFQAVREFLETRQPDEMVFTAKDDEVAGVYQTYLRRESANMEQLGYVFEGPHRIVPYTEFLLRRTKPSEWRS